jgi:DNA repair photolyase
MYKINQLDTVYVCAPVYENEKSKIRLERILATINPKKVERVSYADLNQIIEDKKQAQIAHNISFDGRTGAHLSSDTKRILVFDNFIWDEAKRKDLLKKYPSIGQLGCYNAFTYRAQWNHSEYCVCQPAWEMHSLYGCLHTCTYCHISEFFHIQLNLEELVDQLKAKMKEIPDQQLYKYDNYSDQIPLEPEYGASELLVPFFGELDMKPPKFLLLYTKSDNVDHLLNLKHNGRTIVNWSLSPETQSNLIEKNTPATAKRLLAIKKCYEAGYTVRVRFSPIIPLKNWHEEYRSMIQGLFKAAKPDIITLDILGFMTPEGIKQSLDFSLFDEKAQDIISNIPAPTARSGFKHILPHNYRKEIYQFMYEEIRKMDPTVPITLCNETFDMWEEFEQTWTPKMEVEDYVCCCGPDSVPGNKWLKKS